MPVPGLRIGSLCSGYAGLDLAVHSVFGGELVFVADIDKDASRVLAHRFPGLPNYGDITAFDWDDMEPVDILTAGFPCQPISAAGQRKGVKDERWLFDDICSAVGRMVARPRMCVLENVPGLLSANGGHAMACVVQGLAALGYEFTYRLVRASDAGAPHRRERWFCLAWLAEDADGAAGGERRVAAAGQAPGVGSRADAGGPGGARAAADAERGGRDRRPQDTLRGPEGRATARRDSAVAADPGSARLGELPGGAPAEEAGPGAGDFAGGHSGERADRDGRPAPADPDGDAHGKERDSEPQRPETGHEHRRVDPRGRVLDWGPYGPAIARWEAVLGRPAPRPTEPGKTGERLSPRFVEWMMGLPEGWVTDVPGLSRSAQLRLLGNGVVVQQAGLALRLLLARVTDGETGEAA